MSKSLAATDDRFFLKNTKVFLIHFFWILAKGSSWQLSGNCRLHLMISRFKFFFRSLRSDLIPSWYNFCKEIKLKIKAIPIYVTDGMNPKPKFEDGMKIILVSGC